MAFICCLANLLFFLFLLCFGIYFAEHLLQNFFDSICQPKNFLYKFWEANNTRIAQFIRICCTSVGFILIFLMLCMTYRRESNEHFVAVSRMFCFSLYLAYLLVDIYNKTSKWVSIGLTTLKSSLLPWHSERVIHCCSAVWIVQFH